MSEKRKKNNNCEEEGEEEINNSKNGSFLDTVVDNVKVCVRIRPNTFSHSSKLSNNNQSNNRCLTGIPNKNSVILDSKPEPKVFSFDHVACENSTQLEIFNSIAKPIVTSFVNGFNGCIFAYGQSGSGKTHTTLGEYDELSELKGIIPRTFEYLFKKLNEKKTNGEINSYSCKISYMEIYNEQIFDLLVENSNNLKSLSIREDLKKGIYVEGLKEIEVKSSNESMKIFGNGINNRRVAETSLNSNSSRSHSVLTIILETITNIDIKYHSKLSIIDLAGSERQSKTDASGNRLKESGMINKSLSILGNVIRSLVELSNGKPRHIPYRDSKLTFLLRDSLGGNSKTFIIATCSPSEQCFSETLSTLQFAQRAKHVKNVAIINEDSSSNITLLQLEITRLKEELYKIATSSNTTSTTSSNTINTAVTVPHHQQPFEKRIYDLEVQLSRSLDREEMFESVKDNLISKCKALKVLIEKKDSFLLNTKLILKLRESHIARLEGKDKYKVLHNTREKELLEEISILNNQILLHPDVTKLTIENIELQKQLSILNSNNNCFDIDEINSYKQQIQELVIEVNTLLKEKLQNNNNNNNNYNYNKTPSKSNNNNINTPYLERKKLKEDYDFKLFESEVEKNKMNQDYQKLNS